MKKIVAFMLFSSMCISNALSQTAEQEGIDYGRNSIGSTSALINSNAGQNTVPKYSTDAPESGYFQNGMGNINAVGNSKVNNCLNGNSGSNALNLECEAINLVNKSATSRPIYSIDPKKDEVINNSKQITKEAPKNLENNQTCFVKDVKINPVYEEQQCMQGQAFSQAQCLEESVNDVCPVGFDGNTCNGVTGIDRGALSTTGLHNSYITYEGNKLKFGLGYRNRMGTGSATTTYKVTIRNRSKLQNIKLLTSSYDDAYLLKINGSQALAVNIGGTNDGSTGYSSNQELGQFFIEGENTIELTVYNNVNNSPYYADLIIDIPMYCECTKKKTNTCSDEILKNPTCGIQSNVCQERDWKGNCVLNLQNYVCRDSNFYQQNKSCETTKYVQCRNPSGATKDISECDKGIDFESLDMTQNDGNGVFNKFATGFTVSTSGNDGKRGTSQRSYVVSFNIKDVSSINMLLKQVHYDNRGIVYVNGNEIFNRSTGGNQTDTVNMDLKPFLKNGSNSIRLFIDNWGGPYSGAIVVDTNYQCTCQQQELNTCSISNSCTVKSETCTDSAPRNINGVMVNGCWKSQKIYSCQNGGTTLSDCQQYVNKGCDQIGSVCTSKDSSGKCLSYSQTYRCEKSPARTEKQTVCVQANCIDGKCYQESSEPDTDFGQAVAMMEATREAGVYGEMDASKTLKVFNGEGGTCTVKLLAGHNIMSCCKEVKVNVDQGSNYATDSKQTQAMGNNPNQPAQQTPGSTYQYDDLYNDGSKTMKNLQADLTFGWLECNEQERDLAVKRGGSLCTHARTWCSNKVPLIGCIEESRSYCCFKSILAKIINREGKKQLGLSLEDCGGITVDQLQKLDFSKIDMTEFKESVIPKNINLGDRAEKIKQRVEQQSVGGYYSE